MIALNSFGIFGQSLQPSRAAVTGQVGVPRVVTSEDFTSGSLDPAVWTTSSSTPQGRIQVTGDFGTATGDFALLMDRSPSGPNNLNEAIWTVDVSAPDQPQLSFFHADFGDEALLLPSSFSESVPGDGVSVSSDGITWYTVLNATSLPSGVWEEVVVDLPSVAGLDLNGSIESSFSSMIISR